MPGIVGIITKTPSQAAESDLLRMVNSLKHESFYVTGTWMDKVQGVYVGWVAKKNSFDDQMPVYNETRDMSLVFSGEEFPDPSVARYLRHHGHSFADNDASYLVHLYEESPSFPIDLNGRFHGLLSDRKRGTTMLFNDRYGMHRIYYHEGKDAFYFAAEAKAILAVCPELRCLNTQALGEFVACGCALENRTLFERIYVLPPASAWVFHGGHLDHKGEYFSPSEWESQTPLEPEKYYLELREKFSQNLPRYFKSREPLGMSLTGGLDTRMIMAWSRSETKPVSCYSFGGMFRDCQDVLLARQVAQQCQQPHEVIPVGEEFLARFPEYAERTVYLTDGCAEVNRSPDLYVNERARNIAPVRMTGNYGGEVLRRVRAFKPVQPPPGLFQADFLDHVHAARMTYNRLLQRHPLSFAVFQQAPWHHYSLLALEQTQLSVRTPYLDNDFVRTVFRAPDSACANNDVCLRLISDGNAALRQIRTDRGLNGNTAHVSSFLNRSILEFTFKAEYAYDYGMPQWAARIDHLFSGMHLERLFLGRHKFSHFRIWYRDKLAPYLRETLLDKRSLSRPYLCGNRLRMMVQGHLKGECNYTSEIHKVLTLELFHRQFIDAYA